MSRVRPPRSRAGSQEKGPWAEPRRSLVAAAALLAVCAAQAALWVRLRPTVSVRTDETGTFYRDESHHAVFGSDAMFFAVIFLTAVTLGGVLLAVRRAPLSPTAIVGGAFLAVVSAALVAWLGCLLDGVGRSPLQPFPPGHVPLGQTVTEPARLHTPAVLGAGALAWLLVVFTTALTSRGRGAGSHPSP